MTLLAVAGAVGGLLGGCRSDEVRLVFDATEGATLTYAIEVHTRVETRLAGSAPTVTTEDVDLVARHVVVDDGTTGEGAGARIEVTLERPGSAPRVFLARLDQLGRLAAIEGGGPGAEELPLDFGLAELFPAGTAPAGEPLEPGARWPVRARIDLAGGRGEAEVIGTGRLESLGVVDGRDVARLRSRLRVPVSVLASPGDRFALDGVQQVELLAEHDLADGVLRRSDATTRGEFEAVLAPPAGSEAPPVTGVVRVEVRSTTRRLDVG